MDESTDRRTTEENLFRSQGVYFNDLVAAIKQRVAQLPQEKLKKIPPLDDIVKQASAKADWKYIEFFDAELERARKLDPEFEVQERRNICVQLHLLLAEAVQSRSPVDAWNLIATGDFSSLMDRAILFATKLDPAFPPWSLPELHWYTQKFVDFLTENRDSIIKTGVPAQSFTSIPRPHAMLGNLYPTKPEILTKLFHECSIKAGTPIPPLAIYMRARFNALRGCCANEHAGCNCVDLDFLKNLDTEAVRRIEEDRDRLLEMKIAILTCLAKHVEQRHAIGLWEDCQAHLAKTLLADDVNFYIEMDRIYTDSSVKGLKLFNVKNWRNPGGFSQILWTIMEYEREITFGLEAATREELCKLDGYPFTDFRSYFNFVGHPGLESIINRIQEIEKRSYDFLIEYWKRRGIETIENEFDDEEIIRVKRLFRQLYRDASASISKLQQNSINGIQPTSASNSTEEKPTIYWHGGQAYSIGNHDPVAVSPTEHYVLQAFLKCPAMDTNVLIKTSGLENAPSVLRSLTKDGGAFAPAIRLPGSKIGGGYFVRIKKA